MLQDIHGEDIFTPINSVASGDITIVPAQAYEQHITMFTVIAAAPTVLTIRAGARTLAIFSLATGQTVSMSDIAGAEGDPLIKIYNGEAFIFNSSAAVSLTGAARYAVKNF